MKGAPLPAAGLAACLLPWVRPGLLHLLARLLAAACCESMEAGDECMPFTSVLHSNREKWLL